MSKHTVMTVGIPADVKFTWLPGAHPMKPDGSPAAKVTGIRIPVNKPVEIEAVDERHLALLRGSHRLKFLESKPAEPAQVAVEAPAAPAVDEAAPKAKGKSRG